MLSSMPFSGYPRRVIETSSNPARRALSSIQRRREAVEQ